MSGTVLVTGGTGYLAGWVIVRLLQQGYDVRATVRDLVRGDRVRAGVASEVGGAVADDPARLSFVVADLGSDEGWDEAVTGARYVLHVASPLGGGGEGVDALVRPAREGTTRVLEAAAGAGVERVVVTSSCAAATPPASTTRSRDVTADETTWTDPADPGLTPYRLSKVLAEQTVWDLARAHPELEVTTVLPGAIFGPGLPGSPQGSLEVLGRMVRGDMPVYPRVSLEIVDVRDLADLHLAAMTAPEAAGERFIGTGELLWMGEVAQTLREGLGPDGAKVPRRRLPDVAFRLLARRNAELAALVPLLGRRLWHSPAKAERVLGWTSRPARETVLDSGRYLLAEPRRG